VRCFNYRSIIGLFPPALLDLVGTSHSGVRTSFKAQIQLHIDSRNYDTFSLTVEHQKCPPPLKETTTKGADEAQFAYEHAFILFTQHPSYGEDWDPSQRVFNFLNIFLMGFVLFWVLKYLPWPSSGWWSWSDVSFKENTKSYFEVSPQRVWAGRSHRFHELVSLNVPQLVYLVPVLQKEMHPIS